MKTKQLTKISVIFAALLFLLSGVAVGKSMSHVEGTIQGANCVVNKTTCPLNTNDPHLTLETDFVFLTADGKYYFLPNISRSLKTSYLHKQLRIKGDVRNHSIVVSDIAVKNGSEFLSVWNWEKIAKSLNRR